MDIQFKYLIEANLTNKPIDDGSIYVTTDTKRLYVDLNQNRVLIDGNIYLETEEQKQAILAPLSNKLYIVKSTHSIWMYISNSWVQFNSSGGTSDYEQLTNLPKINSVILTGDKSLTDLGIQGLTDANLSTTDKTIVGAINEVSGTVLELQTQIGNLSDSLDLINGEVI